MKYSLASIIALTCALSALATPSPAVSSFDKKVAIAKAAEAHSVDERAVASVTGTVNTAALKYRTCPKTSCTAVGQYAKGTKITISCRTQTGTTTVEGYPWWDRLSNGYYVSDLYVDWTGGVPSVC